MDLTRTTVRIPPALKKQAQRLAIEQEKSLQDLINEGLTLVVARKEKRKAKKIIFLSQDLGVPLDNLTREDIYAD